MKNRNNKLSGLIFCFIGCLFIVSLFIEPSNSSNFNQQFKNYNVNLQILNTSQEKIAEFKVQIADTRYKMTHGLMDLDFLPPNYGMIFDFKIEQPVMMWMKNTRIALDMLFIDKEHRIINIAHGKPYSLEEISSKGMALMVLEINGGLAKKYGIKVGDLVLIK